MIDSSTLAPEPALEGNPARSIAIARDAAPLRPVMAGIAAPPQ